jgi:hypothetical protein
MACSDPQPSADCIDGCCGPVPFDTPGRTQVEAPVASEAITKPIKSACSSSCCGGSASLAVTVENSETSDEKTNKSCANKESSTACGQEFRQPKGGDGFDTLVVEAISKNECDSGCCQASSNPSSDHRDLLTCHAGGRTADSTTFADMLGDIDCCAGKTAPCCDGMLVTMFGIPTEADGSTESCIDRLTSRECEKNPSGTNKKNIHKLCDTDNGQCAKEHE